jgi:uncharacterized protein
MLKSQFIELETNRAQILPVSERLVIGDKTIELEVARSIEEKTLGLMYRQNLPDNRGMVFLFEPPQPVSFWMKNVLVDLDIIFLKNGKIKKILTRVPPCQTKSCPLYGIDTPVDRVLELKGGQAEDLNLKIEDKLVFSDRDISIQK